MNITLKPEQAQFIQSKIERGIFANPEQAIEAALRLLEEQSRGYEEWVEETREKIEVGLAQLERGEKFPLEVAFERLERKIICRNQRLNFYRRCKQINADKRR